MTSQSLLVKFPPCVIRRFPGYLLCAATGKCFIGSSVSTKRRRLSITAGRLNNLQNSSISLFSSARGIGLDEFLRGDARVRVKLRHLLRHRPRHLERVAFSRQVRHQPGLLRAFCLHGSAR